jgi:4-hydroxy-tetrahydrodipicolinate synthase
MSTASLSLRGIFTAIVTPFTADTSALDLKSLGALIERQISEGVRGVVACGSSGEAATLTDDEYLEVVKFVRAQTKGKIPCVAGISVSATAKAVGMAKAIREIGCDGILVATPPYNKPSQVGISEHLRAIRRSSELPIIAYNIPGRSGTAISSATLGRLSHEGIVMGLKEASGSIDVLADTMAVVAPSCQVVSGDDSLLLATLAYGGVGAISASANAIARELVELHAAFERGDVARARSIQLATLKRIRAVFCESNPIPVKTALALEGTIASSAVRLPLTPLSEGALAQVKEAFSL